MHPLDGKLPAPCSQFFIVQEPKVTSLTEQSSVMSKGMSKMTDSKLILAICICKQQSALLGSISGSSELCLNTFQTLCLYNTGFHLFKPQHSGRRRTHKFRQIVREDGCGITLSLNVKNYFRTIINILEHFVTRRRIE